MIYKRLLRPDESCIHIEPVVSPEEISKREMDYPKLTPKRFGFLNARDAFRPVAFHWRAQCHELQYNFCSNPLCKNFGLPQERFNLKNKPYRYKLSGTTVEKKVRCNPERRDPNGIPTGECEVTAISNWSLSEEIERLVRINSIVALEPVYEFHKPQCAQSSHTPKTHPNSFYKRGTNSAKSQRYQCKDCKKITSILPDKTRNLSFNQKRNEVLPLFAKLLIGKTPINRACEILEIGKGTYYKKLDDLYLRCLEFLETRETKPLAKKRFDELWITTDKLSYVLNNVLKKGRGTNRGKLIEDKQLPTYIVASSDKNSRYVFRADVCYDWDKSLADIVEETELYKDDHLSNVSRKNARFGRYSAAPRKPTSADTQSMAEYKDALDMFDQRRHYVDGLHVVQSYTSLAHFWLLKDKLSVGKWRFISDDDDSLKLATARIFSDEIRQKNAHHFLCLTDKSLTRKQAKAEFRSALGDLRSWAEAKSLTYDNLYQLAVWHIEDQLAAHKFHERHVTADGEFYFTYGRNRLAHPIPTSDRGHRQLDVLTDTSHLSNYQLAYLLSQVNDNAINGFFQVLRRRLSMLERPLVTARGDGKSYIYSNFNPKYSQMAITILRTYYNFCIPLHSDSKEETPAQRLGIADKVYTWEDIIYKR